MTQWKPFFFLGTPTLLTTQKDARLCVRNRTTGKHWNWDNSDWRQVYISRCMRRRGRLLQSGVNKLPSIGYWRPATEGRGEMECNVRRTTCRARDRERESGFSTPFSLRPRPRLRSILPHAPCPPRFPPPATEAPPTLAPPSSVAIAKTQPQITRIFIWKKGASSIMHTEWSTKTQGRERETKHL